MVDSYSEGPWFKPWWHFGEILVEKFRFHIWNVVFRIRSADHKNIRMITRGVEFLSYKSILSPLFAYWCSWICFYLKPNLFFLGSNQHWFSYFSPQEYVIIIQFQMLINHLFQNWEPNNDLNYVGPGVYSVGQKLVRQSWFSE